MGSRRFLPCLFAVALAACVFPSITSYAASPVPSADAVFLKGLNEASRSILTSVRKAPIARGVESDEAYKLVSEKLQGSGVPADFIRAAFESPEVRIEPGVVERFGATGDDDIPYERYRSWFITPERIGAGAAFYREHKALIDEVSERFGVDPFVFISIANVETFLGKEKGKYAVFNSNYTMIHKVPKRRDFGIQQLAAWLQLCWEDAIPPHSVKGSYAGAFGYGQFISTSWRYYAVDYDGDGTRHPFQWPDALGSISNYLVLNGYKPGETDFTRSGSAWTAVFAYNHYVNYTRVVLELRAEIKKKVESAAAVSGRKGSDGGA